VSESIGTSSELSESKASRPIPLAPLMAEVVRVVVRATLPESQRGHTNRVHPSPPHPQSVHSRLTATASVVPFLQRAQREAWRSKVSVK
jgi:hypothetical protein